MQQKQRISKNVSVYGQLLSVKPEGDVKPSTVKVNDAARGKANGDNLDVGGYDLAVVQQTRSRDQPRTSRHRANKDALPSTDVECDIPTFHHCIDDYPHTTNTCQHSLIARGMVVSVGDTSVGHVMWCCMDRHKVHGVLVRPLNEIVMVTFWPLKSAIEFKECDLTFPEWVALHHACRAASVTPIHVDWYGGGNPIQDFSASLQGAGVNPDVTPGMPVPTQEHVAQHLSAMDAHTAAFAEAAATVAEGMKELSRTKQQKGDAPMTAKQFKEMLSKGIASHMKTMKLPKAENNSDALAKILGMLKDIKQEMNYTVDLNEEGKAEEVFLVRDESQPQRFVLESCISLDHQKDFFRHLIFQGQSREHFKRALESELGSRPVRLGTLDSIQTKAFIDGPLLG